MKNNIKAKIKSVRAIIFDLDGVIFNSLSANIAFYNHILEITKYQLQQTKQFLLTIHRESTNISLKTLINSASDFKQAMNYWRNMDSTPFLKLLFLYPYIRETLYKLQKTFTLAVATNRSFTTFSSLAHFNLLFFFTHVILPFDTNIPKPNPTVMHTLLNRLDLKAQEIIYIGDTEIDEKFCTNSGVRFISFRNPWLKAWAHVKDFKQLHKLTELL